MLTVGIHLQGMRKAHLVGLLKAADDRGTLATVLFARHESRIRDFVCDLHQNFVTFGSIAIVNQNHGKSLGGQRFRHLAARRLVTVHRHDSAELHIFWLHFRLTHWQPPS